MLLTLQFWKPRTLSIALVVPIVLAITNAQNLSLSSPITQTCHRQRDLDLFYKQCPITDEIGEDNAVPGIAEAPTQGLLPTANSFNNTVTSTASIPMQPMAGPTEETTTLELSEDSPRTFMSFEDWRDRNARDAPQDTQESNKIEVEKTPAEPAMESFTGADTENSRATGGPPQKGSGDATPPDHMSNDIADHEQREPVLYDDGKAQYYRSKDAGKTCKERFSYSSFDAGATVLKTNQGAKNAKAILVENKDSYMLLECAADNKFVIVELTDDILIDTVVLANFEFFSSMIRQFRVSVSDRYPVKLDKWKELGIFEAKNSRDIQAFLIDNPLIWAKYVRIEFLSHYGNEYYCPVSLLRIHGTRMLDSWKETEATMEDDDVEDGGDESSQQPEVLGNPEEPSGLGQGVSDSIPEHHPFEALATSANDNLGILSLLRSQTEQQTCVTGQGIMSGSRSQDTTHFKSGSTDDDDGDCLNPAPRSQKTSEAPRSVAQSVSNVLPTTQHTRPSSGAADTKQAASTTSTQLMSSASPPVATPTATMEQRPRHPRDSAEHGKSTIAGAMSRSQAPPQVSGRQRNSTSSPSTPPSPIVQESFHKTVSKRLQLLEANVTLSFRYLEEQSRFVQESQLAAERRHLDRINTILEDLNRTLSEDLRQVRQQYEQVWQSTVMSLEGQRAQSQRELLALSSRLNLLADEVVFQKRMAILQAVLLLSCLVLVIFSRTTISQPSAIELVTTSQLHDQSRPQFTQRSQTDHCRQSHINNPQLARGIQGQRRCSKSNIVDNFAYDKSWDRSEHLFSLEPGLPVVDEMQPDSTYYDPKVSDYHPTACAEDSLPVDGAFSQDCPITNTCPRGDRDYTLELGVPNLTAGGKLDRESFADFLSTPSHTLPSPTSSTESEFEATRKPLPPLPSKGIGCTPNGRD